MKDVLVYLINSLLDEPAAAKLSTSEDGNVVRFKLSVSSSDRGKIIGKEGRVVKSIRTLLQLQAAKGGKKVFLDIV
ncbi:MAG TPA: KH domain-containing protein [Elusimicrobiales bacterium]|nr:KH domain-containing protein [Elusimicrobiales bacterium]